MTKPSPLKEFSPMPLVSQHANELCHRDLGDQNGVGTQNARPGTYSYPDWVAYAQCTLFSTPQSWVSYCGCHSPRALLNNLFSQISLKLVLCVLLNLQLVTKVQQQSNKNYSSVKMKITLLAGKILSLNGKSLIEVKRSQFQAQSYPRQLYRSTSQINDCSQKAGFCFVLFYFCCFLQKQMNSP